MKDAPEVFVVQVIEYRKFVILQRFMHKSSIACSKAR